MQLVSSLCTKLTLKRAPLSLTLKSSTWLTKGSSLVIEGTFKAS